MAYNNMLLMAGFQASLLGQSVTDDALTAEVHSTHNMAKDSSRVVKNLFRKQLGPLRKEISKARKTHNSITFEGLGGSRLLVAAEQSNYETAMREHVRRCEEMAWDFMDDYDNHIESERLVHNGAFNISDYPSKVDLPNKFKFGTSILPMPDPNEFLKSALTQHEAERLKKAYEEQIAASVATIQHNTTSELLRLIREVSTTLADEDAPIIDSENRKGALPKLREYLDRIPQVNITNDPTLQTIYEEARGALDVTTDTLRNVSFMRRQTANKTKAIVDRFGAMGARKIDLG